MNKIKPTIQRNQDEIEEKIREQNILDKPIPIGTKFADLYEVISDEQSKGGMGKAILCKNLMDNKYYVLKKAKIKEVTEAFKQEIEFTLKLDKHPNIVYTQTAIKEEDTFYMVMELVGKQQKHPIRKNWWFAKTLTNIIERNEIDLETAFIWSIEFCRGMQYLNSIGLKSHQDIKPDNIFLTEDNHIKIADFGLASYKELFYSGGTEKYFSPEHNKKNVVCDIRSDIYSFGIVMYEMFNSAIINKNRENIGNYICKTIDKKENKYCSEIIKKCLQKEVDKRYQTFIELEKDIIKEAQKYFGENFEVENKQMTAEDYFLKAKGSEIIENYKQALELYDKAIKLNHRYVKAYICRGAIKYKFKQYKESIEDFDEAIKLDKLLCSTYNLRGLAKIGINDFENAIKDFNKALVCSDTDIKDLDVEVSFIKTDKSIIYFNRGYAKERLDLKGVLDSFEEAIEDYNKAIKLNPNYFDAWFSIGVAKQQLYEFVGENFYKFEDFEKCYIKAIEVSQNWEDFQIIYNAILGDMNLLDIEQDATAVCNILYRDNDDYNDGVNKFNLNKYMECIISFDKFLLNPKNLISNDIVYNLECLYAYLYRGISKKNLQQYPSAINDINKAIKLCLEINSDEIMFESPLTKETLLYNCYDWLSIIKYSQKKYLEAKKYQIEARKYDGRTEYTKLFQALVEKYKILTIENNFSLENKKDEELKNKFIINIRKYIDYIINNGKNYVNIQIVGINNDEKIINAITKNNLPNSEFFVFDTYNKILKNHGYKKVLLEKNKDILNSDIEGNWAHTVPKLKDRLSYANIIIVFLEKCCDTEIEILSTITKFAKEKGILTCVIITESKEQVKIIEKIKQHIDNLLILNLNNLSVNSDASINDKTIELTISSILQNILIYNMNKNYEWLLKL